MAPRVAAALRLAAVALTAALSLAGAATSTATTRPCFGAAARDPQHPCFNPSRSVTPAIKDVINGGMSPCRLTTQQPGPVCTFGMPAKQARAQIALVGDSHARHWRAAVAAVARAEHWEGHSIAGPGCFFSAAVAFLPKGPRAVCVDWYRAALRWFGDHPEIHTVFLSQEADTQVAAGPGQTVAQVRAAGLRSALQALPRSVRHVIFIRDVPNPGETVFDCVTAAIAAGRRPGPACATPRAVALPRDGAVETVEQIGSSRYQVADLTQFFCGPADCYPVVGGVLVYRDLVGHLTEAFSRTLAPYLLRRVRFLMTSW
ncbi:MAG: hypothetical protein QOE11_2049 [Solirubrobacteraceae bacterium]|jgi:hypothetical protein|nr:hypothetical protein [Solirubrobacteraceae bacterium]